MRSLNECMVLFIVFWISRFYKLFLCSHCILLKIGRNSFYPKKAAHNGVSFPFGRDLGSPVYSDLPGLLYIATKQTYFKNKSLGLSVTPLLHGSYLANFKNAK